MIYIIILIQSVLFSQGVEIKSELDTNKAFIGNVIKWSIIVEGINDKNLKFPYLTIDNDSFKVSQIASLKNNPKRMEYEIISWDTGRFITPDYSIEILNDMGELDFFMEVPKLEYVISSVLPVLDDKNFRPLKGPVPVKNVWPIKNIISYIIIIIAIYGIIKVWKRRVRKTYKKLDYDFIESPKERAIRRLEELNSSQFTKEFYTQLSHIFREYIERKYYIRTLEMTTEEIKNFKLFFPIKENQFNVLITFLNRADNVKYALQLPSKSEMNKDKEKIKDLLLEL